MKKEEAERTMLKTIKSCVDNDGAWIKKSGKLLYGYKKHHVTDENGLVLGILTTPANVNEIAI